MGATRKKTAGRNLLAWDRKWMRRSGRIHVPLWLHRLLVIFVRSGDGWGWILISAFLFVFLPGERLRTLLGQAAVTLAISIPLYWVLKTSIRRTRPFDLFKSVLARVPPLDAYSFPSGHTMNNLAVATSLAFHVPWLWPLALVMPLSIGLLRVIYGVHFVTDIVGGALIGFGVALVSVWVHAWLSGFTPLF